MTKHAAKELCLHPLQSQPATLEVHGTKSRALTVHHRERRQSHGQVPMDLRPVSLIPELGPRVHTSRKGARLRSLLGFGFKLSSESRFARMVHGRPAIAVRQHLLYSTPEKQSNYVKFLNKACDIARQNLGMLAFIQNDTLSALRLGL